MDRAEAEYELKQIFGIPRFYDEQWDVIKRILNGERVLMIQKTGFGKSLCYQFPATQFPGITVVFSPLIALMRDQVKSLHKLGISAGYVNSEQSKEDNQKIISKAKAGKIKILYIAPERQENQEWIEATHDMNLSMVVVDEAHTISTWGHDFRPAFRRIIDLVNLLPSHLPVLATTATATKRVQKDIENQILGDITTVRGSLVRENFHLYTIKVKTNEEKMLWLAANLNKIKGTGLIYTGTRIEAEIYSKWLQYVGISAIDYHAGYDAETRKDIEYGLMTNRWKCIVSTNALGMGLDKPDIRFVIHTQIPSSPVHYYQEIGRAGRDGKSTVIVLFYNNSNGAYNIPEDLRLPLAFIENARPSLSKYQTVISLLKEEPLGEREIVKKANIKSNQFRIIKSDLIEQGIIREVKYGSSKKFEYQYNAPDLDFSKYEELKQQKLADLKKMEEYVFTSKPRMQFLCEFLDDKSYGKSFTNCDNTSLRPLQVVSDSNLENKLKEFNNTNIPTLELSDSVSIPVVNESGVRETWKVICTAPTEYTLYIDSKPEASYKGKRIFGNLTPEGKERFISLIKSHYRSKSHLTNGVASSYYGVSSVGNTIHRCKYENGGDFPDFLLRKTLGAFYKVFRNYPIDIICYIPPTSSGNLVRNFANKFSISCGIPISHALIKNRETREQKVFQNSWSKKDNVKDAFAFADKDLIKDKTILLIDDIYDSGATLKEAGAMLTGLGAKWIIPIVIAKTVGGTL